VVAGKGLVFFGTASGTVHAIEAATGKERWEHGEKGAILASPALGREEGGDALYAVLAQTGTLVAYRAASGERIYARELGGPILGAPLLANGRIYLGSGGTALKRAPGALYSVEASTGKRLWKRATGARRHRTVKRVLFLAGVAARPALSADGLIYATSQDGFVHTLDGRTGRSRQREMIERQAAYTPAIDGKIAFVHRRGQLFTLGQRGKILGLLTRPPKPLGAGLGSPALTSERIYLAGDGALMATNREASAPLWTYPLPEQTSELRHSAPVVAGAGTPSETVFVLDTHGTLHAVDGSSGKALWTHALGRPDPPVDPLRTAIQPAPALLPGLLVLPAPKGEVIALTGAR
jgi:outer membrane protein assembly factor BamB